MTEEETENLVLEHLRAIRADVTALREGQRDIKAEMISLRKQVLSVQEDSLRQDQNMAALSLNIDRINSRLELNDG